MAGYKTIPAVIKEYSSDFAIEVDYLESNRQREKNKEEKKAEFFRYKQILYHIKQVKKNQHTKLDLKNVKDVPVGKHPQAEISAENLGEISEFLERIGIDLEDNFKTREVLAKAAGISENESRNLLKVTDDDYMANKEKSWYKSVSEKEIQAALKSWYEIRARFDRNEIDLDEAVKQVDEVINAIDKKVKKAVNKISKEPKSVKKPKCYLSLPVTNNPNAATDAKMYAETLSDKYEVFNPVEYIEKIEKKKGVKMSWIACMELLILTMPECKFIAPRGNYAESDGARIEIAIATAFGLEIV